MKITDTKQTNIEKAIRNITGATFANVSYVSKNDTLKTSKITGNINPFWEQKNDIIKVVENSMINLGAVYTNVVNKRLEKNDIIPDFKAKPMKGKIEHENEHKNLCQSTDRQKTYVRYMPMKSNNISVKYMLNGIEITDKIKEFKPIKTMTSTQENAGLNDEQQVPWRTLDLNNITSIKLLGMEYTNK